MSDEEAQLQFLLRTLMQKVDGIESVALVSREGLIVSAVLEEGLSEMHLASGVSMVLNFSERLGMEAKKGDLDAAILQFNDGKIIIMECGMDYILAAIVGGDARMDLVYMNMRQVSAQICDILDEDY